MHRLIDAAQTRHRDVWLLEPHTLRTLLLLLYGTGLRISEAVGLNLTDFDLNAGVLTISETKFHKSRFVPIGSDLQHVLRRYIEQQWPALRPSANTPLLGTRKARPVSRQQAELAFQHLRKEARVFRPASARYQPRLHDFRYLSLIMF